MKTKIGFQLQKFSFALIVFVFSWLNSSSQELSDSAYMSCLRNEAAEYLSDSIRVAVRGNISAHMVINYSRNSTVLIRTKEGIEDVNSFIFPEQFDKQSIQHAPFHLIKQRYPDMVEIDSFAVWRQTGGVFKKMNAKRIWIEKHVYLKAPFGDDVKRYRINVEGLSVGDTIRIYYKYHFPLKKNFDDIISTRVFHNDAFPRRSYYMAWSFDQRLNPDTVFYMSRPVVLKDEHMATLVWKLRNLPGALDEPGSYIYEDLPWFVFSPRPADCFKRHVLKFGINNADDQDAWFPSWFVENGPDENKFIKGQVRVIGKINQDENQALRRVYDSIVRNCQDDLTNRRKLLSIARFINEKVKLDSDFESYMSRRGFVTDKPGSDLEKGNLPMRHRMDVYGYLLGQVSSKIFFGYVMDNRCGIISPVYYSSIPYNDYFLIPVLNDTLYSFVLPRTETTALMPDEFPFYYEHTRVMLRPELKEKYDKSDVESHAQYLRTPYSRPSDNYRKVNSMVNVSLAESKASFQTRVSLSGQYSTMTRNIYRDMPPDTTINPLYNLKVNQIALNVNVLKTSPGSVADNFPFLTSVTSVYEMPFPAFNGDTLTLDLTGWFKHIVVGGLSDSPRFTAFHADFMGSDTWSYMIRFDSPVSIANTPAPVDISTDYGQYTWSAKQVAPDQVLVTSYLLTKTQTIPAQKIDHVARLYDAVGQRSLHTLKLVRAAN